jgi:competence protein ComEC
VGLLLGLFFASTLFSSLRYHSAVEYGSPEFQKIHAGVVVHPPVRGRGNYVCTVKLIDPSGGIFLQNGVKVYFSDSLGNLSCGDLLYFVSELRKPTNATNPGGFNYRDYLRKESIDFVTYVKEGDVRVVSHIFSPLFYERILFPLRSAFIHSLSKYLDRVYSSLLVGLTIGYRSEISQELREVFSDVGIIHILAVSGLHVGIISMFLFILFRTIRIPYKGAITLTCFVIIFYAFFTGLRPPVVRATTMFVFILIGILSEKRIMLLNILAASAILILILNPFDLFDTGFQLSYIATFSIIILFPRIFDLVPEKLTNLRVVRNFIVIPFSISLAAQLGTAPVIAFHFFKVSSIAPFTNLLVVPLVSLIIPVGFITVVVDAIHPFLAKVVTGANWILLHAILKISHGVSRIPFSVLSTKRPSLFFFILYYPLLVIFFHVRRKTKIKLLVYTVLITSNIVVLNRVYHVYHPRTVVHFLDVGQGDASVIEFPGRELCVVDGGRRSFYSDYGEMVVKPFLLSKGISHIHTVIATHPDVDHYGGLITLVEEFSVGRLLINGVLKKSALYTRLLSTAQKRDVPVFTIHSGEVVKVGEWPLYILNPPISGEGEYLPSNESSIVFKFGHGDISFLFTGDFSNEIFEIPPSLLPATILKYPHHGARFNRERDFLNSVNPQIASISVGKDNPFGHPSRSGILILDSLHTTIYRTDRDGAVRVETDGKNIEIETISSEGFPPNRLFFH